MPAVAVFMISESGMPWMRMMIPERIAAARKASMVRAEPPASQLPRPMAITTETGSRKFQSRLVRTPGQGSMAVSSALMSGSAPSRSTLPSSCARRSASRMGPNSGTTPVATRATIATAAMA
ncbi:MAG: hypothetical protein V2J24_21530 [Pseudomonadales bacterium]|jgi:hypothetical protein|nr:hypothetical protein [Pseudomonadales bacterium]